MFFFLQIENIPRHSTTRLIWFRGKSHTKTLTHYTTQYLDGENSKKKKKNTEKHFFSHSILNTSLYAKPICVFKIKEKL